MIIELQRERSRTHTGYAGFEVITELIMKSTAFRAVPPCSSETRRRR